MFFIKQKYNTQCEYQLSQRDVLMQLVILWSGLAGITSNFLQHLPYILNGTVHLISFA